MLPLAALESKDILLHALSVNITSEEINNNPHGPLCGLIYNPQSDFLIIPPNIAYMY